MFRADFHRRRQAKQLLLVKARRRDQIRHLRLTDSQGAGFVKSDGVDAISFLQGRAALQDDAKLSGAADADDERRRRRQPHGARTRNDQHCNHPHQTGPEGQGGAENPTGENKHRDYHHGRHEIFADPVHQILNWRLGGLGVLNHFDNLIEQSILTHLGRPEFNQAVLINGCPNHLFADALADRERFTGHHLLVNVGFAFNNHAVHRNFLARPDNNDVADPQLVEWHRHFLIVAPDMGFFSFQL